MRKLIVLLLSICMIFTLVACDSKTVPEANSTPPAQGTPTTKEGEASTTDYPATPKDQPEEESTVSESEWGVTLSAEDVTPTGLTIVCTQSGGNPSGELDTGSYYIIQKYEDGEWSDVEWLPQEYDVGWTAEAWMIPMNDTVEWEVDWEWLYGELPAGKYRIGKEITDFRGSGDFDQEFHYAEFEIAE